MSRRPVQFVAAACAWLSVASGASAAPATTLHVFNPFTNGQLAHGLRIGQTVRGSCWTGSEGTPRADAWRCMSGNSIYDPCFSDGTAAVTSYVICAQSPFNKRVVKLMLTKRPSYGMGNKSADPTRRDPWFIRLASGITCGMTQGATGAIAGMRIAYGCSPGAGWLVGSPHRGGSTWKIFFTPSFNGSDLTLVPISQAWW